MHCLLLPFPHIDSVSEPGTSIVAIMHDCHMSTLASCCGVCYLAGLNAQTLAISGSMKPGSNQDAMNIRGNIGASAAQLASLMLKFVPLMMGFTSSPLPAPADDRMRHAQVSSAHLPMTTHAIHVKVD